MTTMKNLAKFKKGKCPNFFDGKCHNRKWTINFSMHFELWRTLHMTLIETFFHLDSFVTSTFWEICPLYRILQCCAMSGLCSIRVISLRNQKILAFLQRCTFASWLHNMFHISSKLPLETDCCDDYIHNKWYFESKIG